MTRRTRVELEAENLVLYRELESIRDRLDQLLNETEEGEGSVGVPSNEDVGNED